jgi:hypothetical protein
MQNKRFFFFEICLVEKNVNSTLCFTRIIKNEGIIERRVSRPHAYSPQLFDRFRINLELTLHEICQEGVILFHVSQLTL